MKRMVAGDDLVLGRLAEPRGCQGTVICFGAAGGEEKFREGYRGENSGGNSLRENSSLENCIRNSTKENNNRIKFQSTIQKRKKKKKKIIRMSFIWLLTNKLFIYAYRIIHLVKEK